jgi:hypothetical protein
MIQEFAADEPLVVKTLYNEMWEIGAVNTTNIWEKLIDIIAASFRLTISSCDFVNKWLLARPRPTMFQPPLSNGKTRGS